jgi:hypothetical protein
MDDTWISATSTYNYLMKDPLLDWLKLHYNSFIRKNKKYKNITKTLINNSSDSFTSYIMNQGIIFEEKILESLVKKFGKERIKEIHGEKNPRSMEKVNKTLKAMNKGYPIIHSGVVYNPEKKVFGIPDLLIRSDWLKHIVNISPLDEKEEIIDNNWYYCVVDIKFSTLKLRADSVHILNTGSYPAYKSQLLVYNWGLEYMQGFNPNKAYILGRRWVSTSKGETFTNNTCFDKLGVINYKSIDNEYIKLTKQAIKWIKDVRANGAEKWNILNYPLDRWELYPNMCNTYDYPWHNVKVEIAKKTKELTQLWMVGPKNRNIALENGISQWTDIECIPPNLGINGDKTSKILSEIININQNDGKLISPDYVKNNLCGWKNIDDIEFFVDFETVNGSLSEINNLPKANCDTIIFMIGVGYYENDKFNYKSFVAKDLSSPSEKIICQKLIKLIKKKALKHNVKTPKCIHWGNAEDNLWSDVTRRHKLTFDWEWVDLLLIFKEEPIVINGCMSFGLKDVAKSMKTHGFIESSWESDCLDGQSAMIIAKKSNDKAIKEKVSMEDIESIKDIVDYNEIDVKVLHEIITYLRDHHTTKKRKRESINSSSKRRKIK